MDATCHKCQKKNNGVRVCDKCRYTLCSSCNDSRSNNLCPVCKKGIMKT